MSISATSPFSADGSLVNGQPIQHVTAAEMQAGQDAASGVGGGAAVYSSWQMMTPSDVQLFTAATGYTMQPDGRLLGPNGQPATSSSATQAASNFATQLGFNSLSSNGVATGQSITASGLQQLADQYASVPGEAIDPTILSKGIAYLEQQENGGTGSTINAYA
jgi:hypothetical protein